MDKIDVNGANAHPVFVYLKANTHGSFGTFIKWNFTKFLCDSEGVPFKRFGPPDAPLSMESDIRALLKLPAKEKDEAGAASTADTASAATE
eukprot:m.68711 g.68711  ORF g.68711 m.68711 type:complete len:91 (-) comp16723_c0_seq4:441-713(-)